MSECGLAVEDMLAGWVDRGDLELSDGRRQRCCDEPHDKQQPAQQCGAKHR